MAIPTTLLAFQTGRLAQLTADRDAAQSQLTSIQLTTLPQARKTSDDLAKQSADLDKQIAVLKQSIAQAATAADAKDLSDKLEKTTIALRTTNANQVEEQRTIAALTDSQSALSASLDQLTQSITGAQTAEAVATARQKRIQDAATTLSAPPFDGIVAAATTALTDITTADTRIASDVPADLLKRAVERRQVAVQALADAATSTSTAQILASDLLKQETIQEEDTLFTYLAQAEARLNAATSAIALVVDATVAPLTQAEKDHLTDATLVAAATTAIGAEKARDDAQTDLNAQQSALDDAILKAREADVDADPSTIQAVKDATKKRDDAQTTLDNANAAFTNAMRDDLHRWEAALPDANWGLVDQLEEARSTLNDLKAMDPASLSEPLTLAEAAWVADLYAADKKDRTARWIAAQVQSRAAAQQFETNNNRYRRLTALRGDR